MVREIVRALTPCACPQALERGLQKYCKVLEDRSRLIDEVSGLHSVRACAAPLLPAVPPPHRPHALTLPRQSNEELKTLLNQYLSDRVNEELLVPPTQVIRVDASAVSGPGAGAPPVRHAAAGRR